MARWRVREQRADYRAGLLAALFYNANRDPKKDPTGKSWTDFFPQHEQQEAEEAREASPPSPGTGRVMTEEEMLANFRLFALMQNARSQDN